MLPVCSFKGITGHLDGEREMRELLFKCWDIKKKVWVGAECGGILDLKYSARCNCFMFDNDAFDIPKDVIWCQFTGLYDKNGKEIFEGDILKVTSQLIELSTSKDTGKISIVLEVVKWIDDGWGYEKVKNIQNYPGLIPQQNTLKSSATFTKIASC